MKAYIKYIKEEFCAERMKEFPNVEFGFSEEDFYTCDAVFGNPSIEEIAKNPKLKWIQTVSAGVDMYMKGDFPSNILLTNATGSYGLAISEHLLAMHLSLTKKINLYRDNQKQNIWKNLGPVKAISGSTVLVLGMGDIGSDYAKLAKAMGAYVIGVRRTDSNKPDYVDELYLTEDLHKALPKADVIAVCLPGTAKTAKMINADTISMMKDGVIILNIGRGSIIDTDALCDALDSGKIGGAGLDVTDPEPLPSEHKLWNYDNVLITPHISGGFNQEKTRTKMIDIFFDNLHKFMNNERLQNEVDLKEGYRKL